MADATMTANAVGRSPLRVVFLCTHNSARSQMAEGLLRHDFGAAGAGGEEPAVLAFSAGVVARGVHQLAIAALSEVGVDPSTHASKTVDSLLASLGAADGEQRTSFDVVVTVCDNAREACPYLPARVLNLHRQFDDPSAVAGSESDRALAFARVRDEIRAWLREAVPQWIDLRQSVERRS